MKSLTTWWGKNGFTGLRCCIRIFGQGQRKMKREQDENERASVFWVCYKFLSATSPCHAGINSRNHTETLSCFSKTCVIGVLMCMFAFLASLLVLFV